MHLGVSIYLVERQFYFSSYISYSLRFLSIIINSFHQLIVPTLIVSSPFACNQDEFDQSNNLLFSHVRVWHSSKETWDLQRVHESANEDNIWWHMDSRKWSNTFRICIHSAWATNSYHFCRHARLSFHSQAIRDPLFRFTSNGMSHFFPWSSFYFWNV